MDIMLEKLINAFRVSGYEGDMINIIKEEIKDINYEIKEDKMGNLIIKMGEGSEKLMISANMDQSGVMATYIDDKGFVRINSIGEIKPATILSRLIVFQSGIIGRVSSAKENPKFEDLFVDFGLDSEEQVREKVKEGDVACILASGFEVEDKIVTPGLNNTIGCYALLRVIKEVKELNKEVYFVFSSQGELGGRGARAAAYSIDPDYSIVLGVQEAGDYRGGKGNIKIGAGPIIRIKDNSLIMCEEIKAMLEEASEKLQVKIQYGVYTEGTEGGLIHKERAGVKTGVLAIPIRYKHSMEEMVSMNDVEDVIKVLKELV
jgi:endoglucanase